MQLSEKQKVFLVINLSYFGDILVTNALCQNIKLNYPNSKLIFLVNKPFEYAAKYQKDVDEVLVMDKRGEHRGLFGLLKFAFECSYRNQIDVAFVVYGNDRGILLSRLLNAKRIISSTGKISKFFLTDNVVIDEKFVSMQDRNADLLRGFTAEKTKILPIIYKTNSQDDCLIQKIKEEFSARGIIGLCTVGKHIANYMPIETAAELIRKFNDSGKTVFYFGAGNDCRNYALKLKKIGCLNFVDLIDVTTIPQLADIMQLCEAVVSIDTGTMHMSYASGVPLVAVFYRAFMVDKWAPRREIYKNTVVIADDYSPENIYKQTMNLIQTIEN